MKLTELVYKNFDPCRGALSNNSWIRFTGESGRVWGLGTITRYGFALTHREYGRAIYSDSQLRVSSPTIRKSIIRGAVLTVRIGGIV